MKRFHESVDYIKHRDAKQLFSLTEEVGKMGLLSEEALVDSIESIKINSYKIIRGSSGSRYTTYLIEVYAGQNAWQVSRRYNEFRKLNDELGGLRNLPPLPPKQMFNSFAKEFLDQRKKGLESYLRAMLALPGVRANSSVQNFLIDGRLMLYESASTPSSNYEGEFSFEQEAPSSAIHHMDEMADILDMGDDAVFYSPMSAPREDDESVERRSSGNSSNEENIFRDQAVDFNHTNSNNNRNDATLQGGPAPQVLGRPPVHPKSVKETKAVYKPKLEDFEIIRVLGKGSFGKVCLCRKRDTGMFYAMKSLKKGHIIKRKQVAHTKTERSVLGQVNHPFIVRLHYAFQSSDKLYFVLDYCSGGELFFHLGRAGRFSEALGRFYAAEIALALGCLHSMGVVYRDLKPENILLDTDGHLKIADFGLSKEGIADAVRGTHSFCGTPEYLAPEVLNRTGHGCAVDWWSLGALLYEMLTGLPPWYSQDRQRMFASIRSSELRFPEYLSPLACEILAAFLQRDVTKRLGSNRDIEEIKEHKFFASIDFDALYRKEITPPFVPRVTSQTDTNNFDATFTRLPINSIDGNISASPQPPLHLSTSMSDEPLFAGFTYTEQPSLDKFMRSKKFTPTSPTNLSSNLMFE